MTCPRRRSILLLSLCLTVIASRATAGGPPPARKEPVTDTYFGTSVVDNYRWMENVDSPEVKDWLKGQADYASDVIHRIPGRDSLYNDFVRLDGMRPVAVAGVDRKNGRYFYRKTLPTETVGRLFYRDKINGPEHLLFDPTKGAAGKSVS